MKIDQSGRRRLWLPAAALAVMSLAGAAFTFNEELSSEGEPSSSGALTLTRGNSTPEAAASSRNRAAAALPAAGAPRRVRIDSLGIDAPVMPITADGSSLEPPPDPQDLGWWSEGAWAGAAAGSALITGHTVHNGGGALDDLETIEPGAEIKVRTARGVIRYVARSVRVLDKHAIARQAAQLFSQEANGRLVLVTCEDWDGTGYRSNVVVTGVPVTGGRDRVSQ